jgi:hypothetical protein
VLFADQKDVIANYFRYAVQQTLRKKVAIGLRSLNTACKYAVGVVVIKEESAL